MKRLLILSGKGGTGKTTTAAAFIRFADAKAVADCDVDAPNLHIVDRGASSFEESDFLGGDKARVNPSLCVGCGLCAMRCRFHALRLVGGVCAVDERACEGCGVCAYACMRDAIDLVPDVAGTKRLAIEEDAGLRRVFSTAMLKVGRGNSGKLVTEVKRAMDGHAQGADLAIIDGSPGIGCPVIASMNGVDLALVVAEPSLSGMSDLTRLVETAKPFGVKLAVCVNKWDSSPAHAEEIERYCADAGIPFAGRIPYDKSAPAAINAGMNVADLDCPARDALRSVYERVMELLFEGECAAAGVASQA